MCKSQDAMTLPLDSTQFFAACGKWVAERKARRKRQNSEEDLALRPSVGYACGKQPSDEE